MKKIVVLILESFLLGLFMWGSIQTIMVSSFINKTVLSLLVRFLFSVIIIMIVYIINRDFWKGTNIQYFVCVIQLFTFFLWTELGRGFMEKYYISIHNTSSADGLIIIFWIFLSIAITGLAITLSNRRYRKIRRLSEEKKIK